jgi:uncharacterized protein with GYD domain
MPKFMFHGSYTATGAAGVLKDGGSGRLKAIEALATSVGGSIESMYWAMGADDFYLTADLPDTKAAAAISLTIGASSAVTVTTSELFSAADVDEVVGRRATYRAPGA